MSSKGIPKEWEWAFYVFEECSGFFLNCCKESKKFVKLSFRQVVVLMMITKCDAVVGYFFLLLSAFFCQNKRKYTVVTEMLFLLEKTILFYIIF